MIKCLQDNADSEIGLKNAKRIISYEKLYEGSYEGSNVGVNKRPNGELDKVFYDIFVLLIKCCLNFIG